MKVELKAARADRVRGWKTDYATHRRDPIACRGAYRFE
jgi:hypothetical protein